MLWYDASRGLVLLVCGAPAFVVHVVWNPESLGWWCVWLLQSLFTAYSFQAPLVVGLLQMLVIAPVCYLVARPPINVATARACTPLAAVNVLNLVSGLMGDHRLQHY